MITRSNTFIASFALIAFATASGQYVLESQTQDAGGGATAGASYSLNGTVAQAESAPALLGTTYSLRGGFWAKPAWSAISGCQGDLDHDGDVDLGDFGRFGAAFGSLSGDAGFDDAVDFDNDGDVDLGDFGLFGAEFGRTDCLG